MHVKCSLPYSSCCNFVTFSETEPLIRCSHSWLRFKNISEFFILTVAVSVWWYSFDAGHITLDFIWDKNPFPDFLHCFCIEVNYIEHLIPLCKSVNAVSHLEVLQLSHSNLIHSHVACSTKMLSSHIQLSNVTNNKDPSSIMQHSPLLLLTVDICSSS